jgi:membrane protease YdiL (CAAX protease family)
LTSGAPSSPVDASRPEKLTSVLVELTILWLLANLAIRGVVHLHSALALPDAVLAIIPFIFIYAPVGLCWLRGVDSYKYPLYVPGFRDTTAWLGALKSSMKWFLILLVPWVLGYHLWMTFGCGVVEGMLESTGWFSFVNICSDVDFGFRLTSSIFTLIAFQVFFVAIPEEFFYRGYVQTRLNEVLPRKSTVMGIRCGMGLWLTAIFFAFGHSLVGVQWWHFAIFFPGILFGLLREKTGGVLAPAFLHAACNVGVVVLDVTYGVRNVL